MNYYYINDITMYTRNPCENIQSHMIQISFSFHVDKCTIQTRFLLLTLIFLFSYIIIEYKQNYFIQHVVDDIAN